ncbi:hypothetical protein ACFFX1_19360 [Dactylosporangium sucinum]|uniref:Ferric siderophore reductase C-terminal domain-containing protein n=1 Tax=Dactylosporangium sucinum TaxID=1424081 RepID=A0A917X0R1_9ACTN|nr:(2Fe-2S)-binding protein [Dactylosporangium sucinum]GGM54763.1 hypothetical protein GCM10007977_065560 [Dactylosporangium sucinum]
MAHPLAETADRLNALDPYAGFDVLSEPGPAWVPLDRFVDGGHADALLDLLERRHGRRNVAGSLLGGILAEAVAGSTVAALVLDDRCPDPAADNIVLRIHEEGHLDRRAFRGAAVAVRAAVDDLEDWWAARVVATLTPLFEAVRARAPFGLRLLWGAAADEAAGTAIRVAQLAGRDADLAWEHAQRLVDALAVHAPVPLTRGAPFPVAWPGGRHLFQVRGTCCLYYRSALESGVRDESCCSTCPLRDDGSRHRLLRDYLSSTAA